MKEKTNKNVFHFGALVDSKNGKVAEDKTNNLRENKKKMTCFSSATLKCYWKWVLESPLFSLQYWFFSSFLNVFLLSFSIFLSFSVSHSMSIFHAHKLHHIPCFIQFTNTLCYPCFTNYATHLWNKRRKNQLINIDSHINSQLVHSKVLLFSENNRIPWACVSIYQREIKEGLKQCNCHFIIRLFQQ